MKTETKILGIILFVTVALLFGGVFLLGGKQSPQAVAGTAVLQIDYSKGQKIGSDSAKIKLVEFSDFQCPACKTVEPIIKQVLAKYPDNLQFIYRHFPLPQHQFAREAAIFAEASGEQGKFWEMHDRIFETQADWSVLSEATPFFINLTKNLSLDENQVRQAVDKNDIKTKIEDDIAEGRRLGVNSTPTFLLNGRRLNLKSFADLSIVIDEEIKK